MGQIQNAISGAVGSVAVGAIAEQKTKGLKKEIAALTEKKKKLEREIYARDLEMEDVGGYIEESDQEKFKLQAENKELKARLRHSELKAATAEDSFRANLRAMEANKNKHHSWIRLVKVKTRGEK